MNELDSHGINVVGKYSVSYGFFTDGGVLDIFWTFTPDY